MIDLGGTYLHSETKTKKRMRRRSIVLLAKYDFETARHTSYIHFGVSFEQINATVHDKT